MYTYTRTQRSQHTELYTYLPPHPPTHLGISKIAATYLMYVCSSASPLFLPLYSTSSIDTTPWEAQGNGEHTHTHANIYIYIYRNHTVTRTLAFAYQESSGFSPLRVCVSSTYAQDRMKASCVMVRVSLPVTARYTASMTLKSVGKSMSK